jgi:hypothetical protein
LREPVQLLLGFTAKRALVTCLAGFVAVSSAQSKRPSGQIQFTDVTQAAGIHFQHNSGAFGKKYLPETMGSGVCAIDFDGDGWQDVLFVNSMDWPEHHTAKRQPRSTITIITARLLM